MARRTPTGESAIELFLEVRTIVAGLLTLTAALATSSHAILHKRDDRAAVAWVGLIWLVPILGPLLYVAFGINRIRRKAVILRSETAHLKTGEYPIQRDEERLISLLRQEARHLVALPQLVDSIARRNLVCDNDIVPLCNGDEAYPAMLDAIEGAQVSVALSTYIFDPDAEGRKFCDALRAAVARGVAVRVLIDDVGARYSWPSGARILKSMGVPVARFARTFLPWRIRYMNLRNHRKLLVVDGKEGFTGGMNIRAGNVLLGNPKRPIQDVHFHLRGPVVQHMMQTFAEDWVFSTREQLSGDAWFPAIGPAGDIAARGLADGPDEDFEKLHWTILGAISAARQSVKVVTPYFLPDRPLITSLSVAAMRGVEIDILIPEKNNQLLVQWATNARLWQLLVRGCRIHTSPQPFDHSKLMLVDGTWALIGSANWDPRSLSLNFEFDVECYSHAFVERLEEIVARKMAISSPLLKAALDARSLPVRLRDGIARLATPYL